MQPLTYNEILKAAEQLKIPPCFIYAVATVESANSGFQRDGRVVVRFEKHVFLKKLKEHRASATMMARANALKGTKMDTLLSAMSIEDRDIAMSTVESALQLDDYCAMLATSWGMFQIMGFNHETAGFKTVEEFVAFQKEGESQQLATFCTFVTKGGLVKYMRDLDYKGFARRYNGPNYAENQYDTKLRKAVEACTNLFK